MDGKGRRMPLPKLKMYPRQNPAPGHMSMASVNTVNTVATDNSEKMPAFPPDQRFSTNSIATNSEYAGRDDKINRNLDEYNNMPQMQALKNAGIAQARNPDLKAKGDAQDNAARNKDRINRNRAELGGELRKHQRRVYFLGALAVVLFIALIALIAAFAAL